VKTVRDRLSRSHNRDAGFGLVEIMVSMMLLALIAMAILPALVGSLRNASMNATLATATGLVNQQLEDARSRVPSKCSSLAATDYVVTDSRGVVLKVARTVAACPPAGYPRAISVSVAVTRVGSGVAVSSAGTLVFVEGR
jgi:prepilin-type N-terminal cleavage/methylation domain-containing protein